MVERERVQVEATDDVAVARAATEHGTHVEAVQILSSRQRAVARVGDSTCLALSRELRKMRAWRTGSGTSWVRVRARRAELARAAARHVAADCVRRWQGGDAGHAHAAGRGSWGRRPTAHAPRQEEHEQAASWRRSQPHERANRAGGKHDGAAGESAETSWNANLR